MKDQVSIEIIIISFVMISAILTSQWFISNPEIKEESIFRRNNRYVAIGFGFFLVFAILLSLAMKMVGFGFIMLFLSTMLYSELVRNSLDLESRIKSSVEDRRIYTMSNMVGILSIIFSIILSLMYILEREGLACEI